ncbi:mannose-P-dolichol utilization defect 1 protein-like [Ptychodera flava]|uniref:mannose-P-dolichol utilization defect 1 protein-like n=1 Tax=Ptychodera flava TaxID=63121 RepID=UPI00396A2D8E
MAATSNGWFRTAVLSVLPENCYDEFFVKYNLLHVPCLKSALSKTLGSLIIVGSLIVKLPQILKVLSAKSGLGISLVSIILELSASSILWSYSFANGFPFVAWGESCFLAIQTCLVGVLCLVFAGKSTKALAFLLTYVSAMYILLSGFVPLEVLAFLQSMNILFVISGRMTQAYANYSNGHTGQLSFATFLMLFLGSVARIFTSIQETGDPFLIASNSVSSTCSGIITFQILYYWNVKPKKA